jgi:hypothetical protein
LRVSSVATTAATITAATITAAAITAATGLLLGDCLGHHTADLNFDFLFDLHRNRSDWWPTETLNNPG